MAISLSHLSPHCLPNPQTLNPKPSHFLCYSTKSSPHSIQSNNFASFSMTPSHSQNPRKETTGLRNLLRISIQEQRYAKSLSLVESMASQGHSLHIKLCADLIEGLSSSGKLNQAARVISVTESHRQAKTVLYNVFITGLCRKNKVISAFETLGRMRVNGCQPDVVTCNILVGGLCSQGMLDLAFETVEHFKKYYEVPPNLITYNQLLDFTIVEKGYKEGMKLLDEMESQGILPDQNTHNTVVRALCKAGLVDEVVEILDELTNSGFKLSATAYSALLEALVEKKHFGKVDKVIDGMLVREYEMNNAHLDAMIQMLCEEGLVDKATTLTKGALKNKWLKPGCKCCSMVICSYIKEGHLNKAIDLINDIILIDLFRDISLYNPILSSLCKYGQLRHALEVLDKLEKLGCSPDIFTYTMLIRALWKIGDHVGSVKMVSQLFERGFSPNEVTYGTLISCLCHDGMADEAMQLKRLMVENGLKVTIRIYDLLLLGFCKARRINEAIDLLDKILEIFGEVNEESVVIVLEGLARIGYESEARKIADELVFRKFLLPDSVDLLDKKIYRMSSSIDL